MAHRIVRVLRCKIIVFIGSLLPPKLLILFKVFIYLAALSLCCYVWNFSSCRVGYSLVVGRGLHIAWFLLLRLPCSRAQRLQLWQLSLVALQHRGLPGPGIELVPLALQDRLLSTKPPRKPLLYFLLPAITVFKFKTMLQLTQDTQFLSQFPRSLAVCVKSVIVCKNMLHIFTYYFGNI